MKKFLTTIVVTLLSCAFLLTFVGCTDDVSSITDIERYADMQQQTDKIDVDFDNGTQKGFKFSITDNNKIAEIMNIILSATLNDIGKQSYPPVGNTFITIYQGEKTYVMGVRFVADNNRLYAFATTDLVDKITELATERGAFDNIITFYLA